MLRKIVSCLLQAKGTQCGTSVCIRSLGPMTSWRASVRAKYGSALRFHTSSSLRHPAAVGAASMRMLPMVYVSIFKGHWRLKISSFDASTSKHGRKKAVRNLRTKNPTAGSLAKREEAWGRFTRTNGLEPGPSSRIATTLPSIQSVAGGSTTDERIVATFRFDTRFCCLSIPKSRVWISTPRSRPNFTSQFQRR